VIVFNVWMAPVARPFDEAVDALRDARRWWRHRLASRLPTDERDLSQARDAQVDDGGLPEELCRHRAASMRATAPETSTTVAFEAIRIQLPADDKMSKVARDLEIVARAYEFVGGGSAAGIEVVVIEYHGSAGRYPLRDRI
jgi:hypothetical protein